MSEDHPIDLEDVILAYLKAVDGGAAPTSDDMCRRYPQFALQLRDFFACELCLEAAAIPTSIANGDTPSLGNGARVPSELPSHAGRFQLENELGRGGIG